MNSIFQIPEIIAIDGPGGLIRIPNQIDVPVTPRVLRLIDSPEFQRLNEISQLGLVAQVYPGATHNRFEHSLGVYRFSLLFLRQLAHQPKFSETVSEQDATLLILAALLHDLGHWPFCHPIEDLALEKIPSHEALGREYLSSDHLRRCLREDWGVEASDVSNLINKQVGSPAGKILSSILSGPIDIDKMDYLYRDSLHSGVPYGQNFDAPRLIRSLCLNENGDQLAITQKGKTAAELMVFARYVMFSEVYWHHAVRSATAMFQRGFYEWYRNHFEDSNFDLQLKSLFRLSEKEFVGRLIAESGKVPGNLLLRSLFGRKRSLYKRIASFSIASSASGEKVYRSLSQRPYPWLVNCGRQLARQMTDHFGVPIEPHQLLIDAPPVGLEVQFNVQVHFERENRFVLLGQVSPVVQSLARRQFDDFVKQVRVFIDPLIIDSFKGIDNLESQIGVLIRESAEGI